MKKLLYMLFIVISLSPHTYASKYDTFIGAETGISWADFKGPNGIYQNSEIATYGFKGGVVNNKNRMYVSYQYIDAYKGSNTREGQYHTLTANSEANTDPVNIFDLFRIVIFGGAHAGAININVAADFGESDKYALLYGVQAGIIATFDMAICLEAGYRFSYSNFSDAGTDLSKLQVAYAGINYRF